MLPALGSVLVFPLRVLFVLEQPLPIASQTAVALSTWSFLAQFYLPSQVIAYLINKRWNVIHNQCIKSIMASFNFFVHNNHISILYGTYKGTISLAMHCGLAIHGPPA